MSFREMLILMVVNDNLLHEGIIDDQKVRVDNQHLISQYVQTLIQEVKNGEK
jgi:hypothetical protein